MVQYHRSKMAHTRMKAIPFFMAIFMLLLPTADWLEAMQGSDKDRREYYGVINKRPHGQFHGEWVIGNEIVVTDNSTEFNENEGPLLEGSCAKVHIRNGRIHEIDSESMEKCGSSGK